jgi:putative transcriptional regulator
VITFAGSPDAEYVRRVRARLGLTQREFAKRIGVPLGTIQNWEQGKRQLGAVELALFKIVNQVPEVAFDILKE